MGSEKGSAMRGFVRGAIAALAGCIFTMVWMGISDDVAKGLYGRTLHALEPSMNTDWARGIAIAQVLGLPALVTSLGVYVLLARSAARKEAGSERESRCRRCHYILRGISKPRCPECGEAI
jgi:hypothetical protein